VILLALGAAAVANADDSKPRSGREDRKKAAEKIHATETALSDNVVPSITTEDSLGAAFALIADVAGVTIKPDWESLEAVGLKRRETPSNARLRNVKAGHALKIVLDGTALTTKGVDGRPVDLTYYVNENGEVIPTTRAGYIKANTVDREYDIADIVQAANGRADERIIRRIKEAVDPTSWESAKGTPGKIKYADGKLQVTQLKENHVHVRKLLREIRDAYQLPQRSYDDDDDDGGL